MQNFNMWLDVVLPIGCALISGGLTVLGVLLTIKHENKKNKETIRLSNKPIFYRIDPQQEFDSKSAHYFQFNFNFEKDGTEIEGIFKNTDNSILILDRVISNGKEYYPSFGKVVDKNITFYLYVYLDENINSDDEIIIIVKDVLNNEYKYKIEFEMIKDRNIACISNIIEIK